MGEDFRELKKRIESGIRNEMPQEAHYVFWGELMRAQIDGDLSMDETDELLSKLNLPEDSRRIEAFVLFGDDGEHQQEIEKQEEEYRDGEAFQGPGGKN